VDGSTYHVILKREARNALQRIPHYIAQHVQSFIGDHLCHEPTQRIPGKTKLLKGRFRHMAV